MAAAYRELVPEAPPSEDGAGLQRLTCGPGDVDDEEEAIGLNFLRLNFSSAERK